MKLIDLHTHTFYSDGVLIPSELVYRCKVAGYEAVAITDHADYSNLKEAINSAKRAAPKLQESYGLDVVAGVELTYIPPDDIERMILKAREAGAEIVVVHGETTAENVPPGTNINAVKAGCDILAHPGNIDLQTATVAAQNDVCLELTTRKGHRDTNGLVAERAIETGAKLVINTDSHSPGDILSEEKVLEVLRESGLTENDYGRLFNNSKELLERIKG